MIYTVTFNTAIDYVVYVSELKVGKTNRSQREDVFLGGKGINVSTVLTNLGVETTALGFVAGDTGELVEKGLRERGIPTDFIRLPQGNTRINVKVRGKYETEVNGSGPDIPEEYIELLMQKLDRATDRDAVVLAGSVPASVKSDVYARIMDRLKRTGALVAVDAAGELMRNVLVHRPFLIKPNRAELEGLVGKVLGRTREIMRSGKELQAQGARNVLVSLGGEGALLLDESGKFHRIGVPEGTLKMSVGAGDSMVAGFLAGYQYSGDYMTALRVGAACGSATAFSTTLATKEEVIAAYHALKEMERV
ncbi:MAG: 1-phosphofructokinase [Firmicutes bacterium]|nr:1-phosphofructokinase [Bacillota bacterium]